MEEDVQGLNLTKDQQRELYDLRNRRIAALICIRLASGEDDDPRKDDAVNYYNAQLREIDGKIAKIIGKPPPIVIGLKAANLTARKGGLNG